MRTPLAVSIRFPNVPLNIPGIPPVLRNIANSLDAFETIQRADSAEVAAMSPSPWGVFTTGGAQVLFPDSVNSVEYNSEYRIADFPIERGSFESYNKVQMPFGIRVVMSKGGTKADRGDFLSQVDVLQRSLDLFTVVTPEKTYVDVNFERIGLNRSAEAGAGMVTVEMALREVRESARITYSLTELDTAKTARAPVPSGQPGTTKTPSAVRPQNQGAVQPRRGPPVISTPVGLGYVPKTIVQGKNVARPIVVPGRRFLYVSDKPLTADKAASTKQSSGFLFEELLFGKKIL